MKTLIIFAFTRMIIVNQGNSFTFEKRKCIDTVETVQIDKKVRQLNDSVVVARKGNNLYYYIK